MRPVPDIKALPPWWSRVAKGFVLGGVILFGPWLLLCLIFLIWGRFQTSRETELDVLALLALYPLGPACAGLLLGLVQPWLRHPWLAIACCVPAGIVWIAILSMAFEPHGPYPYSVDWTLALILGPFVGAVAGTLAHDLIPISRRRRKWTQHKSS